MSRQSKLQVALASFLITCGLCLASPGAAFAQLLQMPEGADFLTLENGAVLCGEVPEGFVADASRRRLRPRADRPTGYEATGRIAPHARACAQSVPITLLVTGQHPNIDRESVTVAIDAGRLELRGDNLQGARVGYVAGDQSGSDVCLDLTPVSAGDRQQRCAVSIPRDLPADPARLELLWAPAAGRVSADMQTYDARGRPLTRDQMRLPITRIVLQRMFPVSLTVDLGTDQGRLQLDHPEAVSSVECGNARCELLDGRAVVAGLPASAQKLDVQVRLAPRVFVSRGERLESSVTQTLKVLRCPLDVVSGKPLRGVDDLQILVRIASSCAASVDELSWTASSDPVEVTRVDSGPDGTYVLLWVGRIALDGVTIVASRRDNGSVVAVTSARTLEVRAPNSGVSLPEFGEIDFIPRNREAHLTVSRVDVPGVLVPISVPGAYTIRQSQDGYVIRGDSASSGFTSIRYAYRPAHVPEPFSATDFAYVVDPVQRPIREANVPASIGGSSVTDKPVAELRCINEDGELTAVPSGTSRHIPFDRRDSCRLLLHRSRIPPESGEQRLDLTVTVTAVGGAERGEARLAQQFRLRHGEQTEVIWIRGAKEQFDRIDIRMTQVIDESLFAHGVRGLISLPSAQWTVIAEDADLRFYATAAIPASLYRFSSDPGELGNGPLSLNFGVLSRLTWLDGEGHEGLVGLEAGMMGMGLATDRERQLALVVGLGIAIPLGNPNQPTQAAINIHAWLAYTVGSRTAPLLDDMGVFQREVKLNPWAFIFGPSITVGSIGVFL